MYRELMGAYADVLAGEKQRTLFFGGTQIVLKREPADERDEHQIELKRKERISVYIDGERQADSAIVLGIVGIMNLINSETTLPTSV